MAKIIAVSEALREYPDFTFGWSAIKETLDDGTELVTGFQSSRFGEVRMIVICNDDGRPLWDQYQIHEGPVSSEGRPVISGAVIVPYFRDGKEIYIGLLERIREVVLDPETHIQGQYVSRELPRGFSIPKEVSDETAGREFGEETGKYAKKMRRLGIVNLNNAFYRGFVLNGAALMDPTVTSYPGDSREHILKCEFNPYGKVNEDIYTGKIKDGPTLSAFKLFDVHLERDNLPL